MPACLSSPPLSFSQQPPHEHHEPPGVGQVSLVVMSLCHPLPCPLSHLPFLTSTPLSPASCLLSLSSFHALTTSQAVAREAGGTWCAIHGGCGGRCGGHPPSHPLSSWGLPLVSPLISPLISPLVVISSPLPHTDTVNIHHPPYGQALVGVAWVLCHSAVSSPSSPGGGIGARAGVIAISLPSHSTHQPPCEQLLVRLGVGGVSL